jgi:hypothetical protein
MYYTTRKRAARNYADEILTYYLPNAPSSTTTNSSSISSTTANHNLKKSNFRAMIMLGDGTRYVDIPLIGKTRFASYRPESDKMREVILGFLEVDRHYGAIHRVKQGIPWRKKQNTLIWRGDSTGTRYPIIAKYITYPISDIDVAFSALCQEHKNNPHNKVLVRKRITPRQLTNYKYLLSLEGNDVASGLKWMLYSDSVVFMARPRHVSWALEEFLVPFIHYVPVKEDYSNLMEMVQWARQNDELVYNISKHSTQFIEDLIMSQEAQRNHKLVLQQMLRKYHEQFGPALAQCNKSTTEKPPFYWRYLALPDRLMAA